MNNSSQDDDHHIRDPEPCHDILVQQPLGLGLPNQFLLQIMDRDLEIPHPGEHRRKLGNHHPLNRKADLYHYCSTTHLQEIHLHLHHRNHLHIIHHL